MLKHEEIESAFGRTVDIYKSIDGDSIVEYQEHYDGISVIAEGEDVGDEDVIFLSWTNVKDLVELFFKLKVDK